MAVLSFTSMASTGHTRLQSLQPTHPEEIFCLLIPIILPIRAISESKAPIGHNTWQKGRYIKSEAKITITSKYKGKPLPLKLNITLKGSSEQNIALEVIRA